MNRTDGETDKALDAPGPRMRGGPDGGAARVSAPGVAATARDTEPDSAVFVQSLARGLGVITAFDASHPQMTLSEVAAASGVSRAAARRFLLTLQQLGYVRSDGKLFSLTPQVLNLGTAYLSGLQLPQIAQPHLDRLSAELNESTSVAILDGSDVVYVARAARSAIMTASISVGTRFPAEKTSLGRVLLAYLKPDSAVRAGVRASDELTRDAFVPDDTISPLERHLDQALKDIAQAGWASTDQVLAPGLRSVAVPLHDARGDVVAAVNVSSTTEHDPVAEYLPALQRAASAIEADLVALGPHAVRR